MPLNYVLAIAILITPPTEEHPVDSLTWGTCREVAISWEIMDPREVRYLLIRLEDLEANMKLLRDRYQDLHDAPPLADCVRFPDRDIITDLLSFNREYRGNLELKRSLFYPHLRCDYRDAISETDNLYDIWQLARVARSKSYYITVRRQALKELRDKLGYEAYYGGLMPPYVPIWRFQRID